MENFIIPVKDMAKHIGHKITISSNNQDLVIDCDTCYNEIAKAPHESKVEQSLPLFPEPSGACNMDEGCIGCGS